MDDSLRVLNIAVRKRAKPRKKNRQWRHTKRISNNEEETKGSYKPNINAPTTHKSRSHEKKKYDREAAA